MNMVRWFGLDSSFGLGQGSVAGFCEPGYEPSSFMKVASQEGRVVRDLTSQEVHS